jgi:hypothetical protein
VEGLCQRLGIERVNVDYDISNTLNPIKSLLKKQAKDGKPSEYILLEENYG